MIDTAIRIRLQSQPPVFNPHILAVVVYSLKPPCVEQLPPELLVVHVPLDPFGVDAVWEIYECREPVVLRTEPHVRCSQSADVLFGVIEVPEANHTGLKSASQFAYERLIQCQSRHPAFKLVKVWNYLDAITELTHAGQTPAIQRYQQFCVGRALACEHQWPVIPAGVAIGFRGGYRQLTVFWLAMRQPIRAIENPRQTSAYHYPSEYSPKAPLFSRAIAATPALFISGTASIVESASLHMGDWRAQLSEIFINLQALTGQSAADLYLSYQFKVYIKECAMAEPVMQAMVGLGAAVQRVFILFGDVCRDELLIELEPVAN
jgi:chorismate lyase / 3-hydroxybenzoate synthase